MKRDYNFEILEVKFQFDEDYVCGKFHLFDEKVLNKISRLKFVILDILWVGWMRVDFDKVTTHLKEINTQNTLAKIFFPARNSVRIMNFYITLLKEQKSYGKIR